MDDYILVVEDEILIAMDIEEALEGRGLGPVQRSNTSAEALRKIDERPPRAAVLDVNLSHGDTSLPVARKLSDLGAPFLFVGGDTRLSLTVPGRTRTPPRLSKPFSENQLSGAVARLLQDCD